MVLQSQGIILKSRQEIELMRTSGRILAEIITVLQERIGPGMTTAELDAIAEREIKARKVKAAFKGYRGFPACLCISINDEIVHGIPGSRVMEEGDVVSIDAGVVYQGFYSDSAITVALGARPQETERLIATTRDALYAGITAARPGARMGDVSSTIQRVIEAQHFGVVRKYVGHGIGRQLHEEPSVPNFGTPGMGLVLRPGLCIAIEPMVTVGDWRTKEHADGWTVSTADGSLAAHFEHSLVITEHGPEVLTVC